MGIIEYFVPNIKSLLTKPEEKRNNVASIETESTRKLCMIFLELNFCRFFGAYYKTRNAGIWNNGTPAEHPGIPTKHQRNTNGAPRNNGTIQDEEQL